MKRPIAVFRSLMRPARCDQIHVEVTAFSRSGRECILIGHEGHPEVEGTMGQYDTSNGGVMYLVEDEDRPLPGGSGSRQSRVCDADHAVRRRYGEGD